MTAPRFELMSQRQKVSRLSTEPPGLGDRHVKFFSIKVNLIRDDDVASLLSV